MIGIKWSSLAPGRLDLFHGWIALRLCQVPSRPRRHGSVCSREARSYVWSPTIPVRIPNNTMRPLASWLKPSYLMNTKSFLDVFKSPSKSSSKDPHLGRWSSDRAGDMAHLSRLVTKRAHLPSSSGRVGEGQVEDKWKTSEFHVPKTSHDTSNIFWINLNSGAMARLLHSEVDPVLSLSQPVSVSEDEELTSQRLLQETPNLSTEQNSLELPLSGHHRSWLWPLLWPLPLVLSLGSQRRWELRSSEVAHISDDISSQLNDLISHELSGGGNHGHDDCSHQSAMLRSLAFIYFMRFVRFPSEILRRWPPSTCTERKVRTTTSLGRPWQATFAQDFENVNAANLAGLMWYLEHEVVFAECPRHYNITRILRYKVSLKTPKRFNHNFSQFFAYDKGMCTSPLCGADYAKHGRSARASSKNKLTMWRFQCGLPVRRCATGRSSPKRNISLNKAFNT